MALLLKCSQKEPYLFLLSGQSVHVVNYHTLKFCSSFPCLTRKFFDLPNSQFVLNLKSNTYLQMQNLLRNKSFGLVEIQDFCLDSFWFDSTCNRDSLVLSIPLKNNESPNHYNYYRTKFEGFKFRTYNLKSKKVKSSFSVELKTYYQVKFLITRDQKFLILGHDKRIIFYDILKKTMIKKIEYSKKHRGEITDHLWSLDSSNEKMFFVFKRAYHNFNLNWVNIRYLKVNKHKNASTQTGAKRYYDLDNLIIEHEPRKKLKYSVEELQTHIQKVFENLSYTPMRKIDEKSIANKEASEKNSMLVHYDLDQEIVSEIEKNMLKEIEINNALKLKIKQVDDKINAFMGMINDLEDQKHRIKNNKHLNLLK